MSQSYLSVDDWIERNCEPDENVMPALGRLGDRLIAAEFGVTGWRCTWDNSGRLAKTDRVRQSIPPLAILDLKFNCRPPDSDIVLIPHDDAFGEQGLDEHRLRIGMYSEGVWTEIEGWGKLYLHESGSIGLQSETERQTRQIYLQRQSQTGRSI